MRISAYILLLLLPLACLAQKEDRVWVFGHNAGIDFNDTANPVNFVANCNNFKTASSISDTAGNMLFYLSCDRSVANCMLRDINNNIIPYADSINAYYGTFVSSSITSFPFDSIYYIFYIGKNTAPCGLPTCLGIFYSKMRLKSSGQLELLEKNIHITNETAFDKFATVLHADGKHWWLLVPSHTQNGGFCTKRISIYSISRDSVVLINEQDIGMLKCSQYKNGDAVFSPDGSKFALATYEENLIECYDFNRCTGWLSNAKIIDSQFIRPQILSFSPNGINLFMAEGGDGLKNSLYQYQIDTPNIQTTRSLIYEDTTVDLRFGYLRLAPNNKIFFSCYYGNSGITPTASSYSRNLGVIHSPNEVGVACDFRPYSYYLGDSALATFGLPNMPNYNLGSLPIYQANAGVDTFYCAGDSTIKALPIGGDSVPHITYQWQPAPGIDTLTNRTQLLLPPPQSRWYYVTITDTNYVGPSCNSRVDSVYIEVRTCTGITETQPLQAKLYPNPSNGTLTVELPDGQEATLSLYNLLGQKILSENVSGNSSTINLDFTQGIYIYILQQGPSQLVGRLVLE